MMVRREDWPRVKEVFDSALALDSAAWSGFVAGACGEDVGLRRQVEALLAAHKRAASFLQSPASAVLDIGAAFDEADSTIGPYHIARILGRGGMGVVYEGTHVATGRGSCALPPAKMRLSLNSDAGA